MVAIVVFKWYQPPDKGVVLPAQQNLPKYGPEHVNTFFSMVDRNTTGNHHYICVTDDAEGIDGSVEIVPLWDKYRDLGGCYNRLYTFSGDMIDILGNRFLCIDIDLVITNNIDHILNRQEDFVCYKAPGPDGTGTRMNGGMYMMDAGARSFLWAEFDQDPDKAIQISKSPVNQFTAGTDQAWMNARLNVPFEAGWGVEDGIYDMRQHFIEPNRQQLPDNCCIVMWPGPRDPSQQQWRERFPWIKEHYR